MGSTEILRAGFRAEAAAKGCVAIALGVAAEGALYAGPVGWLYAVFAAALVLATVIFNRGARVRPPAAVIAASGVAALAVSPHWAAFLLAFVGSVAVALSGQANVARDAWQWMRSAAIFTVMIPGYLVLSVMGGSTRLAVPSLPASLATLAREWAFPMVLASVFLSLFLIGNPLMADGAASIFDFLIGSGGFDLADLIASALRVGVVAMLCWPFLSVPDLGVAEAVSQPTQESFPLGTVIRTLVLCNLIFGVQNALDLSVLWGGGSLPADMTLSDYAHRGTYPLAMAAILVGALVMLAMPAGGAAERDRTARWLTFLWLGQTALLTASCLKRMDMYVSAYSLTYLRVVAVVATAVIGIGLVLICLRIAARRSNRWLFTSSALTGLTLLFAGSVTDVGARIAWFNVEHSREVGGEGVHLDLRYLREAVGPPAIPALEWFIANRGRGIEQVRWTRGSDRAVNVLATLTRDFSQTMTDWRAWTVRRHWLAAHIDARSAAAQETEDGDDDGALR